MLKQIDFHIIVGCCLWKVWTKSGKVMTTETALLADKTGAGFVFWARGPMGRRARFTTTSTLWIADAWTSG